MDIPQVERLVQEALEAWDQPGLGIAVVQNDEALLEGGFGLRSMATGVSVDRDTLFGVASLAKPFTAATMAALVDAGRLGWDDRAVDHLPDLLLDDPWITHNVRIRDLLCNRIGLSRAEHRHRQSCVDTRDHLARVRFHRRVHPFRAEFSYCSEGFVAASEIAHRLSGEPWPALVRSALFEPLGMTRSGADHRTARDDANAASPHLRLDGRLTPVPWFYEDHVSAAAGGVVSTAADMARWLRLQLGRGTLDGRRVLSEAAILEMWTPHTPIRGAHADNRFTCVVPRGRDGIRFPSYALGWYVHDYRGSTVVHHTGSIDGFKGIAGILPEHGFGAAILANGPNYHLPIALFQALVDRRLGIDGPDWPGLFLDYERGLERAAEEQEDTLVAARVSGSTPSLPLADYAGDYADEGTFGLVSIAAEGNGLVMRAGPLVFDLDHWHRDVFAARKRWLFPTARQFFARFLIDEQGAVTRFETSDDGAFRRVSAGRSA